MRGWMHDPTIQTRLSQKINAIFNGCKCTKGTHRKTCDDRCKKILAITEIARRAYIISLVIIENLELLMKMLLDLMTAVINL